MNPKINKVIDDIERTKAKMSELQTLLPELERKRIDMEDNEIVRLVRSANIKPEDFPAFIKSLKEPAPTAPSTAPAEPTEMSDVLREHEHAGVLAVPQDYEVVEQSGDELFDGDGDYYEIQEENDADV